MNFARLVSFVVLFLLLLLLWRVKSGFAGKFMRGFSLNRSVIPFNYTYFILYANKLTTKSIFSLLFFFSFDVHSHTTRIGMRLEKYVSGFSFLSTNFPSVFWHTNQSFDVINGESTLKEHFLQVHILRTFHTHLHSFKWVSFFSLLGRNLILLKVEKIFGLMEKLSFHQLERQKLFTNIYSNLLVMFTLNIRLNWGTTYL